MNNQTKTVYAIVALIVIALVGFLIFNSKKDNQVEHSGPVISQTETSSENAGNQQTGQDTDASATNTSTEEGHFSDESDIMAPDVQVFEIHFDGTSYNPSNLTIKNGDIVIFKNDSDGDFWPASAQHPTHTDYPEFDAKKAVAAGGEYEFKFTKSGAWKFHDHLKPSAFGSITVE